MTSRIRRVNERDSSSTHRPKLLEKRASPPLPPRHLHPRLIVTLSPGVPPFPSAGSVLGVMLLLGLWGHWRDKCDRRREEAREAQEEEAERSRYEKVTANDHSKLTVIRPPPILWV
jgi:hypothetical protein